MLQSIFNSRLSIHLIIRHSIYPVGIITRYKLCATTDSQKVELTMKTPLITREGYEKLKQEMDYLWRQERPEVTKKVTWAASLGDRSENADYQYNKKRLREIDRRVRYLTKCLEQLKIVDYSPQQEGKVFGAWVEIENDEGDIKRFRIVGYDEIFGRKDYISIDSPMARALLKKRLAIWPSSTRRRAKPAGMSTRSNTLNRQELSERRPARLVFLAVSPYN